MNEFLDFLVQIIFLRVKNNVTRIFRLGFLKNILNPQIYQKENMIYRLWTDTWSTTIV